MSKQGQTQRSYAPRRKRRKAKNKRIVSVVLMVGIVYSLGVLSSNYFSFFNPSFVQPVQSQEDLPIIEETHSSVGKEAHYSVLKPLIIEETIEQPSVGEKQKDEEKTLINEKEKPKITEDTKVIVSKKETLKQETTVVEEEVEKPIEQVLVVNDQKPSVENKSIQVVANQVVIHEVQPKETLFSITVQYYLSGSFQGKVADFNGISNPETEVKAGMKLELPDPAILAFHEVKQGETLFSITMRHYQQGKFQEQLASYNGIKDPSTDVKVGMILKIPNLSVVKVEPKESYKLRIHKGTNTLTVFRNEIAIKTFPIATGKNATLTPEGTFKIVNKVEKPWFNPENIPGGDRRNPLGTHWLGLNVPGTKGYTYGIHGTNNPGSIGTYASKGCIRMHNSDIQWMYQNIPMQTIVEIVSK